MADILIGGVRLPYDIHGDGPETIVFVHLLADTFLSDPARKAGADRWWTYLRRLPKARAVHAAIAGSRFEAILATGHAVTIERPDAFNALLSAFPRRDPPQT